MGGCRTIGRRVGVLAGAGCVVLAVAVFVVASGTESGGGRRTASIGQGPATTAVTTDPGPADAVIPDRPEDDPRQATPTPTTVPVPALTTPPVSTPEPLPTEVEQMLVDLATQLEQAGGVDGGSPEELTRAEIDALVTEQLRALGIVL